MSGRMMMSVVYCRIADWNGYPSSTGYSEAESRESPKKKKRNRKHRGFFGFEDYTIPSL